MKNELAPTFEAFMAEPEKAFNVYLEAVRVMASFAEMKASFEQTTHALKEELAGERDRNSRLQFRVNQLERMIFGKRSEKLSPMEVTQLSLEIQAEEVISSSITEIKDVSYKKLTKHISPKVHPGRNTFPAHLRRESVVLMPYDYQDGDVYMGEEVTETLEYTSGEIWVKKTVRRKYVKKHDNGSCTVKIADLPVQAIDKCIAGASLLAHVVVSKYIDSLPLYRQIEIFKRVGVEFPSSTVSNWITKVCELLYPLYELLKKEVLKAECLNVDETTMKVIDKSSKKGQTHVGWYWVYLHHWGKLVFFDYKPTRAGEVPESMLKDYRGYIQADGYAVYEGISKRNGNVLVCCMAHVRRKFEELYKNSDKRAGAPLQLMNILFGIEEECRQGGLGFEQVRQVRQERAVPVLDELEAWLKHRKQQNDNDAPMLRAVNYALNRWDKLRVYVTDGMLQLDNNAAERAIRTVAIGRKNYMFSGSHEGAQRSAMLYSLTASCKLNGINPMVWMTDILSRVPYLPKEDKYLEQLLPNNWQPKPAIPSLEDKI